MLEGAKKSLDNAINSNDVIEVNIAWEMILSAKKDT